MSAPNNTAPCKIRGENGAFWHSSFSGFLLGKGSKYWDYTTKSPFVSVSPPPQKSFILFRISWKKKSDIGQREHGGIHRVQRLVRRGLWNSTL